MQLHMTFRNVAERLGLLTANVFDGQVYLKNFVDAMIAY
jgi:hypothetical protein